ncbi:transposase [Actinoallomurus rhizosphaericola]|uniref:transposase n=1 Tax=Actinoallomurus rhizosphaericola TaxID=2952536 RepID=UPI003872E77C
MVVMVRRHELTDAAWQRIEPLLPAQPAQGGRWLDHRTVLNGTLWKPATGAPWQDLPGSNFFASGQDHTEQPTHFSESTGPETPHEPR